MKKIFLTLLLSHLLTYDLCAQTVIPLYKDSIPNSKPGPDEEERVVHKNGTVIIGKISRPTLTMYLPPKGKASGTAVIICPGGGYWVVAENIEGSEVAKRFNEMGVAAFVLKYRIPGDATMVNREIGPLQDAQQAIKIVRERAAEWGINPTQIGIMGFSAGGHLASTAGTHYNHVVIPNKENTSVRPDFMMLIYPVVSFLKPVAHQGSADQLLGKTPTEEKLKQYSNELQVTDQTPPTFLVHGSNDNGVLPQNSIQFYLALRQHNVPAELHIYDGSNHGFGLHLKNTKEEWIDRSRNWLQLHGWIKKD